MSWDQVEASILYGKKNLQVETRQLPHPSRDEVQVAIQSTGLCGSDLHYYNHYANGDILVKEPLTLGHESSGIVVAVGSSVTNVEVGSRVALEVGQPCGQCARCAEGRYNICAAMRFRSSAKSVPHAQGTLQQRLNHPAAWCHKLPDELTLDEGALLEPLSVALQALKRAALANGSSALVLGAGAVGLLVSSALCAEGVHVTIADIDKSRVDFATGNNIAQLGHCVSPKRGKTVQESLNIAKETAEELCVFLKKGEGRAEYDATFECTGVEGCVQTAIYATRAGGKVMLIGMGTPIQTLPVSAAALREVDILGVFRYANNYPRGIALMKENRLPGLKKLITHRFRGLRSAQEAFAMASRTADQDGNIVLKVVIDTRCGE